MLASLAGVALLGTATVVDPATMARAGSVALVVTTVEDELNADGDCSLREAAVAAALDVPVDACPAGTPDADGGDVIVLEALTYEITIPGAGEDLAATGDIDLRGSVRISGPGPWGGGAGRATIDGGGLDRIFDLHDAGPIWHFGGLNLRNGDAGAAEGGAIRVSPGSPCPSFTTANGSLENLTIEGNRAARGGGVHLGPCQHPSFRLNSIVGNTATGEGGGVSAVGGTELLIETSTFSGNTAGVMGGGIWADVVGEVTLSFVTVAENTAPQGAGIWSTTLVRLLNPVVALNDGGNCSGPGGSQIGGVSDDDTCAGFVADDAGLLPLTRVGDHAIHPLAADSPAIEIAGLPRPFACDGELTGDQIASPRPQDGDGDGIAECDAGAVEAPAVPATPGNTPLPDTAVPVGVTASPAESLLVGLAGVVMVVALARGARRRI